MCSSDLYSIPYCLDLDDNLILQASYIKGEGPELGIGIAIRSCRILSSPSRRLVSFVEKHTRTSLMVKHRATPTALDFPAPLRPSQPPTQLTWIQSDSAAIGHSAPAIRAAVEDFALRRSLDVCMIGDAMQAESNLANARHLPSMPHGQLIGYLQDGPPSIGISPLETVADEATLDFIASKSDVKKLLFGGFGHTGVYSRALPYVESDLKTGVLASNTFEGWKAALDECYESAWQRTAGEAARIRELRSASRVARQCWLPALQGAVSPQPFRLGALRETLARLTPESADLERRLRKPEGTEVKPLGEPASVTETEQRIHTLEYQVRLLNQSVERTSRGVDAIYNSAIWRTLSKLAGIAERVIPGLGRRKPRQS